MANQQARRVKRQTGLACQARRLEPNAQGQHASCGALGQFIQTAQCRWRVALIQRPARRTNLRALQCSLPSSAAAFGSRGKQGLQMRVASGALLQ